MSEREKPQKIVALLRKEYPDVKGTALNFSNALELLVATILAAQCTDEKVNDVTNVLFKRYKTPKDYVEADIEKLRGGQKARGGFRLQSSSFD